MGLMLFNVQLVVEVRGNELIASLLFKNNTSSKLYLDGMTLCWKNKIERNMFVITDQNNDKVFYIASIKNREIRAEDFIKLEAGEEFESTVNVNEAYGIKRGVNYTIQYVTYNPSSYDPKDNTLIKMESNKVEIAY